MSSPLLPSALNAHTQAFPVLSVSQIDRIRSCSRSRQVVPGDILFEPGDENVPFYVLLSGGMEIVQPDLAGEHLIAKHGPAQFTGEMTMISGRRCLVRGRVTEPGEFLELTGDGLRSLVARDAELSDIFMRAFILRRLLLISQGQGNVILLGSRHSANTLRLREFLSRNGYPYRYVDLDTDSTSQELLDRFAVTPSEIPVVICSGRSVLRNPSNQELADCLGFNTTIDESQVRDLIIVGAGPAGLAAAVYAGSEGLDVLMIETTAPGGQAGSSSKIENYLGFPTGISGQELATRAIVQAEKFGARMMVAHRVVRLECARRPFKLVLDNGNSLAARAIIIATGAQYNEPPLATSISSKAKEFTTARPSWKRSSVNERTWQLSAVAIPRDKRLFFSRKRRARCTCWCAPASCRIPCRDISFSASKKTLRSSCTTKPRLSVLRVIRTLSGPPGKTR